MISFWLGLGIGVGAVFGVFLAVGLGLLTCYLAGLVWGLIKGKKHYGF
jgi:hypothetical protein